MSFDYLVMPHAYGVIHAIVFDATLDLLDLLLRMFFGVVGIGHYAVYADVFYL